jgi:hypothetical protein
MNRTALPQSGNIEIAEIPLGRGNTLRIMIASHNGKYGLDVRVWFADDDGRLLPTKRGIRMPINRIKALKRAIRAAQEQARKHGILVGTAGDKH